MESIGVGGGSPEPAATAEALPPAPSPGEASGQEHVYPDLNDVPEKPEATRTEEERRAISESLVADRERAKHSAEELRGDTSLPAPPPPPPGAAVEAPAETATPAPATATSAATTPATPATPPAEEEEAKPAEAPPPGDTPPPSETGTGEPAPEATPPPPQLRSSLIPPSLAAEGFNVSGMDFSAFRPKPTIIPASGGDAGLTVPEPETVVASSVAVAPASELREAAHQADANGPFMVFFGDGKSQVAESDRAVLEQAAHSYFANGGTIRVVGHASPDGKIASDTDLLLLNFDKSLERARAVAASLIGLGVPASAIMVEAVGDAVPLPAEYAASAPSGEAAFRRAEIYLQ